MYLCDGLVHLACPLRCVQHANQLRSYSAGRSKAAPVIGELVLWLDSSLLEVINGYT